MEQLLSEISICPVCKGAMDLQVIKTSGDEIIEGILTCRECETRYFIRNGKAYFVPAGMPPETTAYPFNIIRKPDKEKDP